VPLVPNRPDCEFVQFDSRVKKNHFYKKIWIAGPTDMQQNE